MPQYEVTVTRAHGITVHYAAPSEAAAVESAIQLFCEEEGLRVSEWRDSLDVQVKVVPEAAL